MKRKNAISQSTPTNNLVLKAFLNMQGTTPALQCSRGFDIRISLQQAQLGTRAVEHPKSVFVNILLFKISLGRELKISKQEKETYYLNLCTLPIPPLLFPFDFFPLQVPTAINFQVK